MRDSISMLSCISCNAIPHSIYMKKFVGVITVLYFFLKVLNLAIGEGFINDMSNSDHLDLDLSTVVVDMWLLRVSKMC